MISLNEYNKIFSDNVEFIKKRTKINDSKALFESVQNNVMKEFDVFISYSSKDKAHAIFVKRFLEAHNFSVYIDLYDDVLNPNNVNDKTARVLEERIRSCKAIIYIHSQNSELSVWCPWELGFGGGTNKKISIFEIYTDKESYEQIYTDLYPCFEIKKCTDGTYSSFVFDRKNNKKYMSFSSFIKDGKEWKEIKR